MTGRASAQAVVVAQRCSSGTTPTHVITSLDPDSGSSEKGWRYVLPDGFDKAVEVVSAYPATIYTRHLRDKEADTVLSFDDRGRPTSTIHSSTAVPLPEPYSNVSRLPSTSSPAQRWSSAARQSQADRPRSSPTT